QPARGVRSSQAPTRAATEQALEGNLVHLLEQARRQGTTTFEIKSGYGLTVADELQALDIINRHTDESTLIAAHVVPPEYKDDPEGYVDLVIDEIIRPPRARRSGSTRSAKPAPSPRTRPGASSTRARLQA